MMHISLADFVLIEAVKLLLVGKRSQGTYITDLRLSAGEHRGTMNAGNQINLCGKRTNLGKLSAIRTLVIL